MAYRPKMLTPGMVILCLPANHSPIWDRMLDWAIAWSSGPFTHAAVVAYGELIEQVATVRTSPLTKYADIGWAYQIEGLTSDRAAAMIDWARHRLGQPYGVKAIVEDGLLLDAHVWRLLREHPHYVTCSGFVERAARCGAGLPLTHMPLPTPTELAFSCRLIGPRPWDRT